MVHSIRKAVVVLVAAILSLGPSLPALANGCGCGPVVVEYVSFCGSCDPCYVETSCEPVSECCSSDCHSEVVVEDSCGCGSCETDCGCEDAGCGTSDSNCETCDAAPVHVHSDAAVESAPMEATMDAADSKAPELSEDPVPMESAQPSEEDFAPGPIAETEPVDAMLPVPEPTTPVETADEPEVAEPAEDLDSMFNEQESAEPMQPAETTDEPADGFDSMFDEPATESPADESEPTGDFDSMFDEPEAGTEQPAESTEEAADDSFDNMFDEPMEETEEPAPATEEPAEESDDFDDLFGKADVPAGLLVAGGLQSNELRRWTDNTGRYHCQARLVSLSPGEVVIEKHDGTVKRVELRRLSQDDVRFVYGQVVAQREHIANRALAKKVAGLWIE